MKPARRKVQIILAQNRLKEITHRLRVGDPIMVTVKRKLDRGTYLVHLRGYDLVASFDGFLPIEEAVCAIVQKLTPHVVLKLLSHDEHIRERIATLKKMIASTPVPVSVQPLIGETITNVFQLMLSCVRALARNKNMRIETLRSLHAVGSRVARQVVNLEKQRGRAILDSMRDTMEGALAEYRECQLLLDEIAPIMNHCEYSEQRVFAQLQREIDNLIIYKVIEAELDKEQGGRNWYMQIPFVWAQHYNTLELFMTKQRADYYAGTLRLHYKGMSEVAVEIDIRRQKVSINRAYAEIPRSHRSVWERLTQRLSEMQWVCEGDIYRKKERDKKGMTTPEPTVINIKSVHHISLVA